MPKHHWDAVRVHPTLCDSAIQPIPAAAVPMSTCVHVLKCSNPLSSFSVCVIGSLVGIPEYTSTGTADSSTGGVGWKDPGILKFVPTCMWDKRLKG